MHLSNFGQVSVVTSGLYTQDFGTSNIGAWTNNVTFTGWYYDNPAADFIPGTQNVAGWGTPPNGGGVYTYRCGTNHMIGTRPSNGSGGGPCTGQTCGHGVGVRFQNNTGATIESIEVTYTGYQLSTAQDGNNTNRLFFAYRIGALVNDITAGGWTSVPALDYISPNNNATCGGNQIAGSGTCLTNSTMTACLDISIPNGQEIMLRWWDSNNSCNDPHLAIDDIQVLFSIDDDLCNAILPISLKNLEAMNNGRTNQVLWTVGVENEIDFYEIEHSLDGIDFEVVGTVKANGNNGTDTDYSFDHMLTGFNEIDYYRLTSVDINQMRNTSKIVKTDQYLSQVSYFQDNIYLNDLGVGDNLQQVSIYDLSGKVVYSGIHGSNDVIPWTFRGLFIIELKASNYRIKISTF